MHHRRCGRALAAERNPRVHQLRAQVHRSRRLRLALLLLLALAPEMLRLLLAARVQPPNGLPLHSRRDALQRRQAASSALMLKGLRPTPAKRAAGQAAQAASARAGRREVEL